MSGSIWSDPSAGMVKQKHKVQGHLWVYIESETSLGYMTLSQKTMRRGKKKRKKGKREEERRNELVMPRLFGVNGS